jgi:alkylated DNA repair dioxygenase AlkB
MKMNTPIIMNPNFVLKAVADDYYERLWNELAWVQRGNTPRREYYVNDTDAPYTYGRGEGIRTYEAQPWHPVIKELRTLCENETATKFEVCFLNGYRDGQDQLGWHADDSPEMDDTRPIGILSLGARREIYFRNNSTLAVEKVWLEHGSLCIMSPGMQDTHMHRIPKASYTPCGPRVSLTFRGLAI